MPESAVSFGGAVRTASGSEDRHLGQHVHRGERQLGVAVRVGDDRERGDLRARAARRRDHHQPCRQVVPLLEGELADGLGGVDGRAAADGHDGVGSEGEERAKALGDDVDVRVGLHLVEHLDHGVGEFGTNPAQQRGGRQEGVGHDEDALAGQVCQRLQ